MTTVSDVKFSPKRPNEQDIFEVDFVRLFPTGATINTVDCVITVKSGRGSAANMKVGSAIVNGTKVQQVVGGGTNQTYYDLRFIANATIGGISLRQEIIGELFVRD